MTEFDSDVVLLTTEQLDELIDRLAAQVRAIVSPPTQPCLLQPFIHFPTFVAGKAVQVARANANRKSLVFSNLDAANNVFVLPDPSVATSTKGIEVPFAGGYLAYYWPLHVGLVTAEWFGIVAAAPTSFTVIEFLDTCVTQGPAPEQRIGPLILPPLSGAGGPSNLHFGSQT